MKLKGFAVELHGMPRIASALATNDDIGLLGEHIHNLCLAFVSPLGTDDNHIM